MNIRWWQKGGMHSGFAIDDVHIGPACGKSCTDPDRCVSTSCNCNKHFNGKHFYFDGKHFYSLFLPRHYHFYQTVCALTLRRVLCVALASTTTSLICSGTCIGYGFRKEYRSDWPYWLSAVVTTRRLCISLTSSIGLTRRNHGIDYGPVPVHA